MYISVSVLQIIAIKFKLHAQKEYEFFVMLDTYFQIKDVLYFLDKIHCFDLPESYC